MILFNQQLEFVGCLNDFSFLSFREKIRSIPKSLTCFWLIFPKGFNIFFTLFAKINESMIFWELQDG